MCIIYIGKLPKKGGPGQIADLRRGRVFLSCLNVKELLAGKRRDI